MDELSAEKAQERLSVLRNCIDAVIAALYNPGETESEYFKFTYTGKERVKEEDFCRGVYHLWHGMDGSINCDVWPMFYHPIAVMADANGLIKINS